MNFFTGGSRPPGAVTRVVASPPGAVGKEEGRKGRGTPLVADAYAAAILGPAAAAAARAAAPAAGTSAASGTEAGGKGGVGGSDEGGSGGGKTPLSRRNSRVEAKVKALLEAEVADLEALREACWGGVPGRQRAEAWGVLLGYAPLQRARREAVLGRKRAEYWDSLTEYRAAAEAPVTAGAAGVGGDGGRVMGGGGPAASAMSVKVNPEHRSLLHQIHLDVPRTATECVAFRFKRVQACLARLLFLWGLRHPASGYVQGVNDLAVPFFQTFLERECGVDGEEAGGFLEGGTWRDPFAELDVADPAVVSDAALRRVEADTYWCLSRMVEGVQDNYTFAQPGIQRRLFKLRELVTRVDRPLADALERHGIEFLQFGFRWINCLLSRELPHPLVIKLWDCYCSEGIDGFPGFHTYVCAALITSFSRDLVQCADFQDALILLQKLPTHGWDADKMQLVLAQAYMWRALYGNSPNHTSMVG